MNKKECMELAQEIVTNPRGLKVDHLIDQIGWESIDNPSAELAEQLQKTAREVRGVCLNQFLELPDKQESMYYAGQLEGLAIPMRLRFLRVAALTHSAHDNE